MDDSLFARLGYDPVRIYAHIHGHKPAGIAQLGSPPAEAEAEKPPSVEPPVEPDLEPLPEKAADSVDPPRDGEVAARSADGGDSPADAALEGSALHPDAAHRDLPPRPGEDREPEPHELVVAWLNQHWDAVEAMARAGEAPRHPPPPPEEPETPEDLDDAEPPPPPYVEPENRWTKWKMAEFLRQLAATHSVTKAADKVKMSRQSAYRLRSRLKGQPFDVAWEAAFRHGYDNLAHSALELALEGEEVPHYYQGEVVGTHRKRNPQLIVQLLKMRNSMGAPMLGRYGAAAEYWSEEWERMAQRVETGSVTWSDEQAALGVDDAAAQDFSDEGRRIDRIIARNLPDARPKGGFAR